MPKFCNKFKKPCLWPIFDPFSTFHFQFRGQNFYGKASSVTTVSYGFLTPYQNLEKTNDIIPRKRTVRRKDGQTQFYRTDPSGYSRGSNKANC